jgi:hypothetical protein
MRLNCCDSLPHRLLLSLNVSVDAEMFISFRTRPFGPLGHISPLHACSTLTWRKIPTTTRPIQVRHSVVHFSARLMSRDTPLSAAILYRAGRTAVTIENVK